MKLFYHIHEMLKSIHQINGVLLEVLTNSIVIISQKKKKKKNQVNSMYLGQDF